MIEAGLFTGEHVELIQGRIIMLRAQGPHHLGRVNWLTMLFTELLTEAYGPRQRRVAVQVQSTTRISMHDVLEADLALLDVRHRRLHVFRQPDRERADYLERQAYEQGEVRIETLDALPPVAVDTLFRHMDADEC